MTAEFTGIKNIEIVATTQYPIVSAYEYEFLKVEAEIQSRMSNCSIYFILQRPLIYFNEVTLGDACVFLDIVDTVHEPLHCKIDLPECGLSRQGEHVWIELQFYKKEPDLQPPYNDVAAFKIARDDGAFVVWESPQKLLYEAIANGMPVRFDGNVNDYLTYHVHYIGQAFSQKVWSRLTGHHKMQKILTLQDTLASKNARAPFEITLLMLDIIGFDEVNLAFNYDFAVPAGVTPIVYDIGTEDGFAEFNRPRLEPRAQELTSEAEAMLINMFKPSYNDVLFDRYPNISNGTRKAGYTHATLRIDKLPVILETEHHTQPALDGPVELDI